MTHQERPSRGRFMSLALLGAAALTLSGCMRMQVDMTVAEDDTVDGTVVFAFQESILELMGDDADSLFAEMDFESDQGVTVADYEQDGFVGKEYTFAATPLADFNSDGGLTITREGDEFVVAGQMDLQGDSGEEVPGMEGMLDSFDISITLAFPGEVTSSNGEITGNSVTWKPVYGEANPLEARAGATGGGSGLGLILGIVAAVVVIGAAVALVIVNNTKKKAGVAAAAAPAAGIVPEFTPLAPVAGAEPVVAQPFAPEPVAAAPVVEPAVAEPVVAEPAAAPVVEPAVEAVPAEEDETPPAPPAV